MQITSAFMHTSGEDVSKENLQRSLTSFKDSYLKYMETEDVDIASSPILNTLFRGDVGQVIYEIFSTSFFSL
jgi:hypothetical protein